MFPPPPTPPMHPREDRDSQHSCCWCVCRRLFIVFSGSSWIKFQMGFGPSNLLPAKPHNILVVVLSCLSFLPKDIIFFFLHICLCGFLQNISVYFWRKIWFAKNYLASLQKKLLWWLCIFLSPYVVKYLKIQWLSAKDSWRENQSFLMSGPRYVLILKVLLPYINTAGRKIASFLSRTHGIYASWSRNIWKTENQWQYFIVFEEWIQLIN